MLTDRQIRDLIACPKVIVKKELVRGYKKKNHHQRCDLALETMPSSDEKFTVFTRQNIMFIENFSIGLRYQTNDPKLGTITLVRYNGPHGEYSRPPDGHYAQPHIHRITATEIASGNTQPQERDRKITSRYSTFENALVVFFGDIGATNYGGYFPELLQGSLF